jgi:hypothetical protein
MPTGKTIAFLRSDSVAYQAEIINYCEKNRIQFAIGADCDETSLGIIETLRLSSEFAFIRTE